MLVAAGSEIDNLDPTPPKLFEENVLGFEVAVNDSVSVEGLQAQENGMGKLSHQSQAKALELVLLDELVQVDAEQFKRETDVVSEGEVVQQVDYVVRVLSILFFQVFQNSNLLVGLPVKSPLVANNLQCDMLLCFVVVSLQDLPKASLSQNLQYLIPVRHMVVCHHLIAPLVIIIASVLGTTRNTVSLLCMLPHEEHLWVPRNLLLLECGQSTPVQLESFLGH